MLLSYLKAALRHLRNDRMFSLINIFGLSVGFATCMLIYVFIQSELSYDDWIEDAENVYRVESKFKPRGREAVRLASTPGPIRDALLDDYSVQVETSARLVPANWSVRRGDTVFNEFLGQVDANFFDVIPLEFTSGSAAQALSDANSLILNSSMVEKYFGNANPIGEILTLTGPAGARDYRVAATVEDLPDESHLAADMFVLLDPIALEQAIPGILTNWSSPSTHTYIRLRPGADVNDLRADAGNFSDRRGIRPSVASYADYPPSTFFQMQFVNVRDIHLGEDVAGNLTPNGSMFIIAAFSGIAVLLLMVASVNFINLSTARSLKRAREVALRKTLGASRGQLVAQFVGESVLTVLLACILALAMVELLLPWYNATLERAFSISALLEPLSLFSLLGVVLLIGVVSGAYPAFFVTNVKPAFVLRANKSSVPGSALLRTALVTFQFAVAIALVVANSILGNQIDYVTGMDRGYRTDNIAVLGVPFSPQVHDDAVRFKNELKRIPGVQSVAISSQLPTATLFTSDAVISPKDNSGETNSTVRMLVGYDFFQTYGIEPVAGRLFNEQYGADLTPVAFGQQSGNADGNIILNESAVRRFGYTSPQDILGEVLRVQQPAGVQLNMTVVGVIPDVPFGNARDPIQPAIFYYVPTTIGVVSARVDELALPEFNEALEAIWQQMHPHAPLNVQYIEDIIGQIYAEENRQGQILSAFTILTIIVASMGLFGLAAYVAERRTKEVGIRKVLGASNVDIVRLFVWSLSKPIVLANLLAWPVAWYFMSDWLNGFVHRVDISLTPFVVAGVAVAAFGGLTVAGRTYKVARTHPAQAIRYE